MTTDIQINNNIDKMSNRILYLDLVKGVAITLVCIGHICTAVGLQNNNLYNFIYTFHMPLFMLLCGYFSHRSFQLEFFLFLRKKSIQLLLPILFFAFCKGVYFLLTSVRGFGDYLRELWGLLWFLKTLWICYVVVYITKRLIRNDVYGCILSIIIMLPFGTELAINSMLFYFWMGYFARQYWHYIDKNIKWYGIIAVLMFIAMMLIVGVARSGNYNIYRLLHDPFHVVASFIRGLSGSMVIIVLCRIQSDFSPRISSFLGTIGKYTLGIYVIQQIIIETLLNQFLHHYEIKLYDSFTSSLLCIILGILATLLCYYIVVISSKIKLFNLLLYGNQYH